MKNILFLDYDGCINTLDANDKRGINIVLNGKSLYDTLHVKELIENVNALCDRYSMDIVLISSWREHYLVDDMKLMMNIMGFTSYLDSYITTLELDVDFKDRLEYYGSSVFSINRALQINHWLSRNQINDFLIIDDNINCGHFHINRFIHTNKLKGFDDVCYNETILKFDKIFLR